MEQLPPVAKSFSDYCPKCEAERFHKVLTHVNDKSAKIECEICGKKRTFKIGAPKKAAKVKDPTKVKTPRAKKPDAAALKRGEWQTLNDSQGGSGSRQYSIKEHFSVKEKIQHPKFGLGFVTSVTTSRVVALFADGEKTLVQGQ